MNDFYVYAYLEPDGTPFYIGKGRGTRDRSHLRLCRKKPKKGKKQPCPFFYRKLRKMLGHEIKPTVIRVLDGLNDDEAQLYERFFISSIGRRDQGLGPLCNLTDGGDGRSGRKVTKKERANSSASKRRHGPTLRIEKGWNVSCVIAGPMKSIERRYWLHNATHL